MKIILIGLPKVGKSTIGKALARKLKLPFIDSDIEVEKNYGAPCRDIYQKHGEKYFRALEERALCTLPSNCVLATGGGTLTNPKLAQSLSTQGSFVYLRASPEWLFSRFQDEGNPAYLLHCETIEPWLELASARTPIYEKYATMAFSVDQLSQKELINQVVRYCDGK